MRGEKTEKEGKMDKKRRERRQEGNEGLWVLLLVLLCLQMGAQSKDMELKDGDIQEQTKEGRRHQPGG